MKTFKQIYDEALERRSSSQFRMAFQIQKRNTEFLAQQSRLESKRCGVYILNMLKSMN